MENKTNEQISKEFYDLFFNTIKRAIFDSVWTDTIIQENLDTLIDFDFVKSKLLKKMQKYNYIKK